MSGLVLGPDAYKVFTTPRRLPNGRTTTYGCGINIVNKAGDTVLRHEGVDSGFMAYNVMVPVTRSAVVVLSNRDVPPWDLVNDVVALLNKAHRPPPLQVVGPSAENVAREVFAAIQSGRVDRSRFGEDFNVFLTDVKVDGASARLRPLGAPTEVHVEDASERGGMEEAVIRFAFGATKLQVVMFRSADGKVQQFLIFRG